MAAFPPANGQTTTKVPDENADKSVVYDVVSDGTMTSIVSGEHNLLPEGTQKTCRRDDPATVQAVGEETEQYGISDHLLAIL